MLVFGVALGSGVMLVWPLVGRLRGSSAEQVGAAAAVQLINRRDALVLDVRDAASFAAGHILNARNIPAAELDGRMRELERYKSRPVIVSADGAGRAAAVCGILKKRGFAEAVAMRGGIQGWAEASLPLEKKAT